MPAWYKREVRLLKKFMDPNPFIVLYKREYIEVNLIPRGIRRIPLLDSRGSNQ